MTHTTDPNDPRLGFGSDDAPRPQQDAYLVLSESIRQRGFVRPVMRSYRPVGQDGEFVWVVWVGTDHLTWEPGGELQHPAGGAVGRAVEAGVGGVRLGDGLRHRGDAAARLVLVPSDDCVTANRLKVGT